MQRAVASPWLMWTREHCNSPEPAYQHSIMWCFEFRRAMGVGNKIVPGTNLGLPRDLPAHLGLAGFAAWAPVAGPTALLRPSPPPGICRHIRHGATGRVMQDSNVAALRQ